VNFLKRLFLVFLKGQSQKDWKKEDAYSAFSDEELVRRIVKDNNAMLYGSLYDRYAQKVYHKCLGFAKSDDEAEDLTQDVFLMVFIKLASFKEKSKFSSWLYAMTYNFCVNYVNRNKERRMRDNSHQIDHMEHKLTIELDDSSLLQMRSDKLRKALNLVDPNDKTILLLKYQDDVSIKELCELMEIGESAVKMRLKRAKSRIVETYNMLP